MHFISPYIFYFGFVFENFENLKVRDFCFFARRILSKDEAQGETQMQA
jgi:hypothetical protein